MSQFNTDRKTGRTTRLIIDTIQRALKTPGRRIVTLDHYGDHAHDEAMCKVVSAMLTELGVAHTTTPNSVTVTPIQR